MVSRITELQTSDGEVTLGELIRFLLATPEFKVKQLTDGLLSLTEHTHDFGNLTGTQDVVLVDDLKKALNEFDEAVFDALEGLEKKINVPYLLEQIQLLKDKPEPVFDTSKLEKRLNELESRKPENKTTVIQNFDKSRIDKIEKKQSEVIGLIGKIVDDSNLKIEDLRNEIVKEIANSTQKDGKHVNIIGGVGGVNRLKLLFDVNVEGVTNGQTIVWDAVAEKWVPGSGGGGGTWGSITGTLSNQTDLQAALDAKQATLVSGTNIKTINSISLLGSGDIAISATPGGSNGQIQFNNSSTFGGAAAMAYATSGTHLLITSQAAGNIPFAIRAHASQAANIMELQNNSSTVLCSALSGGGWRMWGTFDESTSTPGVYGGQAASSPRMLFANGTPSANWQIDNNSGQFRWFLPGVVRMAMTADFMAVGGGPLDCRMCVRDANASRVLIDALNNITTPTAPAYRGRLDSATVSAREVFDIFQSWANSTDATRAGRVTLRAYSTTTAQEGLRIEGNSGGVRVGFFGATAAARSTGWAATNYTPTKTLDGSTATLNDVINVLATLLEQEKTYGLLGA